MNQNNNELYHYGVLGMKWGRRKAKDITSVKKESKKSKKDNKKWSTKKKVLVGLGVTTAAIAGVYGAKKIRDYVRNENDKIASRKALKAFSDGWEIWGITNNHSFNMVNDSYSPTAKKMSNYERSNLLSTMSKARQAAAEASYNQVYNTTKNVSFGRALRNVINEKKRYR